MILLSWEAAYRLIGWKPWHFPAPSTVWRSLVDMLQVYPAFDARPLVSGTLVSLARLAGGFGLSLVLGLALGLLMWRSRVFDEFAGPLALGLQTLPSVCWVPLAVLLLGLEERGILFVVVMGSFFAIALALRDGLRTIPPIYQRAGLMLGARGWRLYAHVLLPASLPALASSLRQGFSFAWRSLLGAELILHAAQRHGLGFWLDAQRNLGTVADVVAVMVVMVAVGMAADRFVFGPIQERTAARFGLSQA